VFAWFWGEGCWGGGGEHQKHPGKNPGSPKCRGGFPTHSSQIIEKKVYRGEDQRDKTPCKSGDGGNSVHLVGGGGFGKGGGVLGGVKRGGEVGWHPILWLRERGLIQRG